jgi:hypothetical protein
VIDVTIGRIITASTTPPASIVEPVEVTCPLNSGIQPKYSFKNCDSGRRNGRMTMMPQRPNTIEGTAASRSTM